MNKLIISLVDYNSCIISNRILVNRKQRFIILPIFNQTETRKKKKELILIKSEAGGDHLWLPSV